MADCFVKEHPLFFSHDAGAVIRCDAAPDDGQKLNFTSDDFIKRLVDDGVGFLFIPGSPHRDAQDQIVLTSEWTGPDEKDPWWGTREATEMLYENLYAAMSKFCSPFCYFGAHPGNGSDIGFWFSTDDFDQAKADGVALEVPWAKNWTVKKVGYEAEGISYEVTVDWPDKLEDQVPKGWTPLKIPTGHTHGIRKVVSEELTYIYDQDDGGVITIYNLGGMQLLQVDG